MSEVSSRPALRAEVALMGVVFIWGATFILVQEAIRDASTLLFLTLRFSLATVALSLAFFGRYRKFPAVRRSLKGGFLAGLCLFATYVFQTVGLRYTSAPKSAFITSLSVVAVPLLAALVYRSAPHAAELAGVVLATFGLALLTLQGPGLSIGLGDLLTVLCAISYAIQVIVLSYYSATCSIEILSLTQVGTVAAIAGAGSLWAETPRIVWSARLFVALAVTALLATALAFTVQTWAQKYLSPTRIALLLTLEPLFAWLTSYVVAGESLSRRGFAGGVLILAGVLLAELKPFARAMHP